MNKNTFIPISLISILVLAIFSGCTIEEGPEPYVRVSTDRLEFEPEGSTYALKIESNCKWDIKFNSNYSWFYSGSKEYLKGEGNQTVNFKAAPNTTRNSRRDYFYVKAEFRMPNNHYEYYSEEIVVAQEPAGPDLSIKFETPAVLSDAFSITPKFNEDQAYSYQIAALSKYEYSGYTKQQLLALLSENEKILVSSQYFHSWGYRSADTSYVIFAVAYAKDGTQGDIYSYEIKTRPSTSQPTLSIYDIYSSNKNSKYTWSFTVKPYQNWLSSYSYYVLGNTGDAGGTTYDRYSGYYGSITAAHDIVSLIASNDIESYTNEQDLTVTNYVKWDYLFLFTWAKINRNDFSGEITRNIYRFDDRLKKYRHVPETDMIEENGEKILHKATPILNLNK